jgi:tetratricopeptide (TPR) repeat protein
MAIEARIEREVYGEADMSPSGFRFWLGNSVLGGLFLSLVCLAPQCVSLSAHSVEPSGSNKVSRNAAILDQARVLVQGGNAQGALSILSQADLHGPGASDIHVIKGVCFALLAKPVESAAEFDEAITLRPNHAPTYFSAGLAFANFGNLDRALDCLSKAVKLAPDLPWARYNYALVLARAGQFEASEKQVDLELESPGKKTESQADLWSLKFRDAYYQKKWQDTIDSCEKTLRFEPGNPEAYAALGEALFSLNRSGESLKNLEKALSLDPENGTVHALLGKLYQEVGDEKRAIAEFEAADRFRPNDQDVIFRLYRIYIRDGDSANAARLLKELKDLLASQNAQSQNQAKATVLNNTGVELEKSGDLAGALDQFDKAAQRDVTNVVFQRNAALILCKLGRTDEAIRRLRDILAVDPDEAETLQILAVANEMATASPGKKRSPPEVKLAH